MKIQNLEKNALKVKTKMVLWLVMGVIASQAAYSRESRVTLNRRNSGAIGNYVETNLYYGLLGREPDQAGFDFWIGHAKAGRVTCAQLAASFIMTPQFQARMTYSQQSRSRSEVLVHTLYFALLSRRADSAAVAYFLSAVENGTMTGRDLARAILQSPEFDARCRTTYGFPKGAGTFSGL